MAKKETRRVSAVRKKKKKKKRKKEREKEKGKRGKEEKRWIIQVYATHVTLVSDEAGPHARQVYGNSGEPSKNV